MNKCRICNLVLDNEFVDLCEECFHREFQRLTGKKPVWKLIDGQWEEVYEGIGFKE